MFSLQTENYQRITQHAEGMSLRYGVIVLRDFSTERWFAIGFINTCYSYNH